MLISIYAYHVMNALLLDTKLSPATKRLICRCCVKGCGFVKSFDVPTVERHRNGRAFREVCTGTFMTIANEERCPNHPRHLLNVKIVAGKFSASRVCDARCTGAIGHNCDCQCGGANHGADYL